MDFSPFFNSLKAASIATVNAFILGLLAAKLMYKYQGKFKGLLDGILNLPLVLPPSVIGFILLYSLGSNSYLGTIFDYLDIQIIFTFKAIVIAETTVAFPLVYRSIKSSLEQININSIHAAKTLGISELKIFYCIMLPQAWVGVISGLLLGFARAIGEFGATLMIAGNIPKKTQTMSSAIYFYVQNGEMFEALIWVVIIVIISLGATVILNFWLEKKLRYLTR